MTDDEVKIKYGSEFRRCLVELDVKAVRELWKHVAPHLEIHNDREALYTLHMARTEAQSVPLKLRQYSDRWLRERGFGSNLPPLLRENPGRYI
jgi:hypothetical protein